MGKFEIGDQVIAMSTQTEEGFQKRIKGATYPVKGIMYCSRCGDQLISISDDKTDAPYGLCACGGASPLDGFKYTNSKHFTESGDLKARIKKAEKAEDFEMAAFLLSTLNEMG